MFNVLFLSCTIPFIYQEEERDAAYITTSNYCADGKHVMYLDEQIGYLCRNCSFVETEIRHILPDFVSLLFALFVMRIL
jgi:hypothetical protein